MVRVGDETKPRRIKGFPAIRLSFAVVVSTSGFALSGAPGAACGQMSNVVVLAGGCHAVFWQNELVTVRDATNNNTKNPYRIATIWAARCGRGCDFCCRRSRRPYRSPAR